MSSSVVDPLDLDHRRPCVGSGHCCKRGPCGYGEADPKTGACTSLVLWEDAVGNVERYRCGKYEEISKQPTANVMPAFGEGCCQPLFNQARTRVLNELQRTEDGRVHLTQLFHDLHNRVHKRELPKMTKEELQAIPVASVLDRVARLAGRDIFGAIFLADFIKRDEMGAMAGMTRSALDSDKLFELVTKHGLDEKQAIETIAVTLLHEIRKSIHNILKNG